MFLIVLLGWSAYLSWAVFVEPSLVSQPLLTARLDSHLSLTNFFDPHAQYSLIHYSNTALLLVSLTTLALFFATGIYADKIAYAYKFVPQTNRALRPFNVYLNTRARGWRGWLGGGWRWFGGGLVPRALRPEAPLLSRTNSTSSVASAGSRPASPILGLGLGGGGGGAGRLSRRTSGSSEASFASTTAPSVRSVGSGAMRSPQHSPPASPTLNSSHLTMPTARPNTPPTAAAAATATTAPPSPPSITAVTRAPLPSRRPPPLAMPLAPIPPPANARGELIFSSRVSGPFREGYEKYREGWEARRAEQAGASGSGGGWLGGWFGK